MKRVIAATVVVMALALATSVAVSADASSAGGRASCIGWGSSTARASDQSRNEIAHFIKESFADFGASSPGGVYNFFAKIHAASEEACFGE